LKKSFVLDQNRNFRLKFAENSLVKQTLVMTHHSTSVFLFLTTWAPHCYTLPLTNLIKWWQKLFFFLFFCWKLNFHSNENIEWHCMGSSTELFWIGFVFKSIQFKFLNWIQMHWLEFHNSTSFNSKNWIKVQLKKKRKKSDANWWRRYWQICLWIWC